MGKSGCASGETLYKLDSIELGGHSGAARTTKGALRMRLWVRFIRGIALTGCILGGVVVGSVGIALLTVQPAFAQANSIVVEGNRRVEADTVRSYFRTGAGERLDAAKIDQALKALYATGLFQDVRISQPGGRLVVTVVENPVINRIAFEGNKKVKDEQLTLEVQSKARGTYSRPTVQADVQRIVEIYRRNGRFDIRVEPKIIELPNNRVDLVFEVNEGVKTGVKQINFVGNRTYSDYRLKDVLKTSESNWLSFLQTTDVYDPDRIEADRDLIRRFYLKNGYADVRIISAVSEYDPEKKGFIVTFTIDEGGQYRVGTVDVQSNVRAVDPGTLRSKLRAQAGDVYNAEAIEKTVEDMTIEVSKRGYAFATVRPRGDRNTQAMTVNLAFVVEEGPRAYVERINIRGNTRTRDYVIRREFDIAEGDAYNRALIDRAERRLKNLTYFKTVKITNEPGSAPDRVVVNVDVDDQPTGEFSVAGGYSTADGFMAEVSLGERNLLGQGQYAKASVQVGQRARGFELSYAEPYLFGYRLLGGADLFVKQTTASNYVSYDTRTIGSNARLGFALTEEVGLQLRYSIYRQEITLPTFLNDCNNNIASPAFNPTPTFAGGAFLPLNCYANGEASLPVRVELARGPVLTSLVGYTLGYNNVDNNKSPTKGLNVELKQDFAGVGGDVNFIRSIVDLRNYHEVFPDVVGVVHLQAGKIAGWGSKDLRMLDHFQLGPGLVRGFEPSGIGPRDLTIGTNNDALGGTNFWGASVELQTPLFFLPKEIGVKAAVYADAGSLWGYKGPTTFPATNESVTVADSMLVRSSVGVGLIWDSPFGPLRFDYARALTKASYDRTQVFSFGGGTRF
ncbi:MAG: outer membrane protein insertion porin family [Alphaproteobacteria bacterium]|nr:outer membrane protein insertion porin family [Alphaproteobacteria bacterium]